MWLQACQAVTHTHTHTRLKLKLDIFYSEKADVNSMSTKRSRKKYVQRNFSRRYLTNASGKDLARLWRPHSDVI